MQEQASRPIFIGGTGRSGTSILKRILAGHSQVFGLPSEARFITDPDGLIDLANALSIRYSAVGSDKPLRRFRDLMHGMRTVSLGYRVVRRLSRWVGKDLFTFYSPSEYAVYGNGRDFGLAHFDRTLDDFLQQLEAFRYRGIWPGSRPYRFRPVVRRGRRFARADILEKCRQFTHELYAHRLTEQHKTQWVEDTPGNMMCALQLHEMFPDMKLIHVFRDPRDVVASYARQRWAPSDRAQTVWAIADHIEAWLDIRGELPSSDVFLLRFEDFIAAPKETLQRLCEFLEVPFEPALLDVNLSRHNIGRFRTELSSEIIALTETTLSAWMQENGYPVSGVNVPQEAGATA